MFSPPLVSLTDVTECEFAPRSLSPVQTDPERSPLVGYVGPSLPKVGTVEIGSFFRMRLGVVEVDPENWTAA